MNKKVKMIISYIALILWMGLIFYFSSQTGGASGGTSDGLIKTVLKIIGGALNIDFTNQEVMHIISTCGVWVRKMAHFTEYFILGLLMTNALGFTIKKKTNFIIILVLLCFIYALSDELHQIFVPGRNGNIKDALIDLSGSYAGIMTFMIGVKVKEIKIYIRDYIKIKGN